ncbi:hypothetical protein ACFW3D_30310 [Streptomyces sp. NPDC058864]
MATLLRVLIDQQGWNNYASFRRRYRQAAREPAAEVQEPSLANVDCSESTYERWYDGRTRCCFSDLLT